MKRVRVEMELGESPLDCGDARCCQNCGAHPLHQIRVEDQNGAEVMHVFCPDCRWESVGPELGDAEVTP